MESEFCRQPHKIKLYKNQQNSWLYAVELMGGGGGGGSHSQLLLWFVTVSQMFTLDLSFLSTYLGPEIGRCCLMVLKVPLQGCKLFQVKLPFAID